MKVIKAQRFPNGESRFTVFTPSLIPVSNESHDETGYNTDDDWFDPLTLSANSDRHTGESELSQGPKTGYGKLGSIPGYTLNARRRILRAGGAIDRVIESAEQCVFLTGTLPGGSDEAKRAIAEWSAYAVNLVQSWLGKRVPEKLLIYAWEFQKRGALHLHITMVCKDPETRKEIISEWKDEWTRVIDNISMKSGVDCWQRWDGYSYANGNKHVLQTDAQECRASAAAYLSKYMSKRNLQPEEQYNWQYHPSRYWGISRPLCKLIEEFTETVEVLISSDYVAESAYEDISSVAQSEGVSAYNYIHEYTKSRVLVFYDNTEKGEGLWADMKSRLVGLSRFIELNGRLEEDFLSVAKGVIQGVLRRALPLLNASKQLRTWLGRLMTKTSILSRLNSSSLGVVVAAISLLSQSILDSAGGLGLTTQEIGVLRAASCL